VAVAEQALGMSGSQIQTQSSLDRLVALAVVVVVVSGRGTSHLRAL
jgi:hypothetical protein